MADGLRDLVLVPMAMVASLVGLLRGGDEPQREFQQVLDLGIRTERWIDLFGQHANVEETGIAPSIDAVFTSIEKRLKQKYRVAGTSEHAQAEIDAALKAAQREAQQQEAD